MQFSDQSPAQRLLRVFWRLKQTMFGRVNPKLRAEHGLDFTDLLLLRRIAETDFSPSELAEELLMPPPAISRKLDHLEGSGLITRALDPADARRRVLTLTERGEQVLRAAKGTVERELNDVLRVLDGDELEAFFATLERVTAPTQENK
jgi:DNA-binding MarR family transcriptional regulator